MKRILILGVNGFIGNFLSEPSLLLFRFAGPQLHDYMRHSPSPSTTFNWTMATCAPIKAGNASTSAPARDATFIAFWIRVTDGERSSLKISSCGRPE